MSREPSPEDTGRGERQPDEDGLQELRTEMRQMTSAFSETMRGLQTLAEAAQRQRANAETAHEVAVAKVAEEAAAVKAAEEATKVAVAMSKSAEPAKAGTSRSRDRSGSRSRKRTRSAHKSRGKSRKKCWRKIF